ncbi:MAG: Gfo/Idh/MocA family oxidoreductase [Candidatus Latescibacterota bacterium]
MAGKLRMGVLGMAHDHVWGVLKDLAGRQDAELVAGADPNPALRERFTERTACQRVYDDYDELLHEQEPDGILACGPTAMHADVVEMCAAHQVPVMVEKPMAATLQQASRMLQACRGARTILMVNWPTAWSRTIRTAYRLTQEGVVGMIWQITWRGGHSGPDELGCSDEFCEFLFDADLNGAGAFNDYAGYGAGLCVLFLGGIPTSVVGMAGRLVKSHLPVDDNGIVVMRYPHAMCRLEMTWTEAVPHQPPHDPVIYGTEGTLVLGEELMLYTRRGRTGSAIPLDELPEGQRSAIDHFIHCVRTRTQPQFLTSPDLSYDAQQIMEAGLRSATSGMEITLPVEDHLFRL